MARPRHCARAAANMAAAPKANIARLVGSGTVWPASENVALNVGVGLPHGIGPDPQLVGSEVFVANPCLKIGEASRERRPRRHDRLGRREPEEIAARPNEEGRDKDHPSRGPRCNRDRDPQPDRTRILEIFYRPLYWRREIMRAGLLTSSVRRRKGGRSGVDHFFVSETEGGASR